eukprot:3144238-Amphidinium_carterae.1
MIQCMVEMQEPFRGPVMSQWRPAMAPSPPPPPPLDSAVCDDFGLRSLSLPNSFTVLQSNVRNSPPKHRSKTVNPRRNQK